jgi:hypothetical protein
MQQVQFINGHLLVALDSALMVDNDPQTRDGAAWFEIKPNVDSHGVIASLIPGAGLCRRARQVPDLRSRAPKTGQNFQNTRAWCTLITGFDQACYRRRIHFGRTF